MFGTVVASRISETYGRAGSGGLAAERQAELVASFAELVATVPAPECGAAMADWLRGYASLRASLDGLQLGVTSAFDSSMAWAVDGARSAVSWLVGNTGESRASLGASLKTARLARATEHINTAALAGDLSAEKVRLLTRARTDEVAELFDDEEQILAKEATLLSVDQLRVHLSGWRLRALESLERNEPDGPRPIPETEADRINLFEGFAGRGLIDGELNPDSREALYRAVGAQIDAWHRDGDLVDDGRSRAELNAAAILELVRRGSSDTTEHGHPRPLVIALADWDSLTEAERESIRERVRAQPAGQPDDREDPDADLADPVPNPAGSFATQRRCEIVGAGPVPVTTLARLLAHPGTEVCRVVIGQDGVPIDVSQAIRARTGSADPPSGTALAGNARSSPGSLLARLSAAPSAPLDLGRRRRHASWAQWLGLLVRSGGTCEVPGCAVAYWRTHVHHLDEWDHGGSTDMDNLVLACHFDHHHTIHRRGFTLTQDPAVPGRFKLCRPDGSVVEVPFR